MLLLELNISIGTHEWEKFVKPDDLIQICKDHSLNLKQLDGMKFNLLSNEWGVSPDTSVNYIAKFKKD